MLMLGERFRGRFWIWGRCWDFGKTLGFGDAGQGYLGLEEGFWKVAGILGRFWDLGIQGKDTDAWAKDLGKMVGFGGKQWDFELRGRDVDVWRKDFGKDVGIFWKMLGFGDAGLMLITGARIMGR